MQAVYRLDKIKSKNLILIILGFAKYRHHAGYILFKASRMFRRLLLSEARTSFLSYTEIEDDEGIELSITRLYYRSLELYLPNIFCEDLYRRKLNFHFFDWSLIKRLWKDSYRVNRLYLPLISFDQAKVDELSECLRILKPEIVRFDYSFEDRHDLIKQPFIVRKLEVGYRRLLSALEICKPSQTL